MPLAGALMTLQTLAEIKAALARPAATEGA